jgi:DNA polymerase-3 subunit delta'
MMAARSTLLSDYPWLKSSWLQLWRMQQEGRLPHALMIQGVPGLAKRALARFLARTLLCANGDENGPCEACKDCNWSRAETHADLQVLAPEEERAQIKIDAVRQFATGLTLRPHHARVKVAVIESAEQMNVNASNSLLKTLEEPVADTHLVLVTNQPQKLPITVRSRCVRVQVTQPPLAELQAWLSSQQLPAASHWSYRMGSGAPLAVAASLDEEPMQLRKLLLTVLSDLARKGAGISDAVKKVAKADSDLLTNLLCGFLDDLIRANAGLSPQNSDASEMVLSAAQLPATESLIDYRRELLNTRYRLQNSSYNRQIQLERVFSGWIELCRAASRQR